MNKLRKNLLNSRTNRLAALSAFYLSFSLLGCQSIDNSKHLENTSQLQFFNNLSQLCGQIFIGKTTFPEDPEHDFAGKKLVATIKNCTEDEIRIPFSVGEDRSRTWIITKTEQGLLLKHDHRHLDGTPDEITLYGGYAADYKAQKTNSNRQFFHADAHTAKLIPAAKSNVWMLEYHPKKQQITYYLERNQQPRYQALLNLQK